MIWGFQPKGTNAKGTKANSLSARIGVPQERLGVCIVPRGGDPTP